MMINFYTGRLGREEFLTTYSTDYFNEKPNVGDLISIVVDGDDEDDSNVYVVEQKMIDYTTHEICYFVKLYDWDYMR